MVCLCIVYYCLRVYIIVFVFSLGCVCIFVNVFVCELAYLYSLCQCLSSFSFVNVFFFVRELLRELCAVSCMCY